MNVEGLYKRRCYVNDVGKLVPHFWQPNRLTIVMPTLWGSSDLPVQPDWGVEDALQKTIAIALCLEINVGKFVDECQRRDLPPNETDVIKKLLKANVADEAKHEQGFKYAADVFPINPKYLDEANCIRVAWEEAWKQSGYPLEVPQIIETGVFMILLGFLRLAGGSQLASLAARVSQDEQIHVATNRTILRLLGLKPEKTSSRLAQLKDETLSFVFSGVNIPEESVGEKFNLDFLRIASDELLSTGEAKALNEITYVVDNPLPFEVSNRDKYFRGAA